jgi:hypothetical protein
MTLVVLTLQVRGGGGGGGVKKSLFNCLKFEANLLTHRSEIRSCWDAPQFELPWDTRGASFPFPSDKRTSYIPHNSLSSCEL